MYHSYEFTILEMNQHFPVIMLSSYKHFCIELHWQQYLHPLPQTQASEGAFQSVCRINLDT